MGPGSPQIAVGMKRAKRKPRAYESWYVAKTIGKKGKNFQPFLLATENAEAKEAARYMAAKLNHVSRKALRHHVEPLMLAAAAQRGKTTPINKVNPGARFLQERGLPYFRTTATFQYPF